MPSPEAILTEVRAAFDREPRLNRQRSPIHMDFSDRDGILTIEGKVEHVAAKKVALELAAAVPGVSGIVDRLHVTPAQPMDDGTVRNHICDAFIQEPVLQTCTIQVQDQQRVDTVRESFW